MIGELTLADGARIHVRDETHTDPWGPEPEVVLLVHGMCESSEAWFAWLPHLTRQYRVVRPDLRGLGRSGLPEPGHPWSMEGFADDLAEVLGQLGVARAHVVGAKMGGAVALTFAARHPQLTTTVTALGPVIRTATPGRTDLGGFAEEVAGQGLRGWAASSMRNRLGTAVPEAQVAWWIELFAATDERVTAEILTAVRGIDLEPALGEIRAPAKVMVTAGNPMHGAEEMRRWVAMIPDGTLDVVAGDGYHLAASAPDTSARTVAAFLAEHPAGW